MSGVVAVSPDEMVTTLRHYPTVSEAYWRALELAHLRETCRREPFDRPMLEIGCGNGTFAAMLFPEIDEGVDLNPRAIERARSTGVYRRLRCADASGIDDGEAAYATVFSNCVLEHVDGLARLLARAARMLRPGGKLLATVPLREMNDHLLVRSPWYAELRRRQLAHLNLLDESGWVDLVRSSGFRDVRLTPYLFGEDIRMWDRLDLPVSIGVGRYRVSTATNLLLPLVPRPWRERARARIAAWMASVAGGPRTLPACAAIVVATR